MPKISTVRTLANKLLNYRLKNLVKHLSDGWSITAASDLQGNIMTISVIDEVGHFQSQISEEDLELLIDMELLEGKDTPGKSRFDIVSYTLRKVA